MYQRQISAYSKAKGREIEVVVSVSERAAGAERLKGLFIGRRCRGDRCENTEKIRGREKGGKVPRTL